MNSTDQKRSNREWRSFLQNDWHEFRDTATCLHRDGIQIDIYKTQAVLTDGSEELALAFVARVRCKVCFEEWIKIDDCDWRKLA